MTSSSQNSSEMHSETLIIYDGECPFCKNYVRLLKLKDAIGHVRLINARDNTAEVRVAQEHGYDLDEGMICLYNNKYYHGADAIHIMAMLSGSSRILNRINHCLFKSERLSAILYPVLRCGRNLTLKILGRKKISGEKF